MNDHDLQPLGILGGTFDPVHFGHLRLAEEARDQIGLETVRWIPAGQPRHRDTPDSAPQHRLEMVRLAIAGNPAFQLDAAEAQSTAPSYTVPTLLRLRAEVGDTRPLVLLLGVDAFLGLTSWHRWQELFGLTHIAVASRPGSTLELARMSETLANEFSRRRCSSPLALGDAPAGGILPFNIAALDISATLLRASFMTGRSGRYLLPDPVLDYIGRNRLYS